MINKSQIKKKGKELLDIHERVITNYLHLRGLRYRERKLFFKLYYRYINWENIHEYYNYEIRFFIQRLVRGELDRIRTYYRDKKKKKKRK